MIIKKKNPE